jgi:hypothetical protein
MVDIKYLDQANQVSFDMEFADLVELIQGSSIKSAMTGANVFEIGISESFNISFSGSFTITVASTLNKGDIPPVKFQLVSSNEVASAALVERRIHAFRQLYAANFLLNDNRAVEVANAIKSNPSSDLEELLDERDRLFIAAASQGSFWVTLVAKTGSAFRALSQIAPAFFEEGRRAIIERARATTTLKQLEAEQKQDEIVIKKMHGMIDIAKALEKIKDPNVREKMSAVFSSNLTTLGQPPLLLPKSEDPVEPNEPRRRPSSR